jgi:hypothetical protein
MAVEIRIDRRHARVLADLIDRLMADRTVSFEERLAFDELIAALVHVTGQGDIRLTLPPNT